MRNSVNLSEKSRGYSAAADRRESAHVTVGICTYKRPEMLDRLLRSLVLQVTDGFTFSVVVIDNDAEGSAREVVESLSTEVPYVLRYELEPEQNIAKARNRALASADGRFLAFIDDDEYPRPMWLSWLVRTQRRLGASAVLGPVVPKFVNTPRRWVERSRLCDRERYVTGTELRWSKTRSGNVLLDREAIGDAGVAFDPEYGVLGGEDVTFFRRFLTEGRKAVWCDEAVVHEWVPESRTSALWFLKRAFLQGHVSFQYHRAEIGRLGRLRIALKGAVAMACYLPLVILSAPFGFHRAIRYLVKWTHHASRSLAALGLTNIQRRAL